MVKDKKIRKLISEVVDRIKEKYEPEKIILFGSYAYGKPTEDSDIDLFIVKDTDKRWVDRYVEVKRLIYDPERRISISPIVYTPGEMEERLALGDQFVEEILTKGEVLYAREAEPARHVKESQVIPEPPLVSMSGPLPPEQSLLCGCGGVPWSAQFPVSP